MKAEIKKRPALYALLRRVYPSKKFFTRLLKSAFLWPLLYRTSPISNVYGFDRGAPIDRYYIEKFLTENADRIRGVCLEIKDNRYTKQYGGKAVAKSDVLDINVMNANANTTKKA